MIVIIYHVHGEMSRNANILFLGQKLRKFKCKGRKNPCHGGERLYDDDGARFFPHLTKDDKYIQCGAGRSCHEMDCDPGLVWKYNIQACDWP